MKSQDVVVLLKLVSLEDEERSLGQQPARHGFVTGEDPYSVRGLEAVLGISKTEVGASIKRSIASGLAIKDIKTGHPKPNRRQLREFIVHGLKFVFPAKPGSMQRGLASQEYDLKVGCERPYIRRPCDSFPLEANMLLRAGCLGRAIGCRV